MKKAKLISVLILIIFLTGCSTYWLRGEQHTCRGCETYYYGENCPKCGEDYYTTDSEGNAIDSVRGDGAVMIDGKVVGDYDEKLLDGTYKYK